MINNPNEDSTRWLHLFRDLLKSIPEQVREADAEFYEILATQLNDFCREHPSDD